MKRFFRFMNLLILVCGVGELSLAFIASLHGNLQYDQASFGVLLLIAGRQK